MNTNYQVWILSVFALLMSSCADKVADGYEVAQKEYCEQNPSACISGIVGVSSGGSSSFSQGGVCQSTFIDSRDGKSYKSVQIGGQCWMAENLNYDAGNNNSRCYNDNNSNCNTYGRLYLGSAVNNICPIGWKLPSSNIISGLPTSALNDLQLKNQLSGGYYIESSYAFGGLNISAQFWLLGGSSRWGISNSTASNIDIKSQGSYQTDFWAVRCYKDSTIAISSSNNLSSQNNSSVLGVSSVGSSSSSAASCPSTFVDSRDSKSYKAVLIGTQCWMAENLNYGTYISDGGSSSTLQSGEQKFCYNNTTSYCDTDGGLYQWHTAMGLEAFYSNTFYTVPIGNIKGICPTGWHLPKSSEWDALQTYLGSSTVAGSKMKVNNSGFSGWDAAIYNNGNSSGFGAFPAGYRSSNGGFGNRGLYANILQVEQNGNAHAWFHSLGESQSEITSRNDTKFNGFSIRCIRD